MPCINDVDKKKFNAKNNNVMIDLEEYKKGILHVIHIFPFFPFILFFFLSKALTFLKTIVCYFHCQPPSQI